MKIKIPAAASRENMLYTAGFILVACLAAFLHFYKLAEIPYGIHVDEAAIGYDALSLARYGVTRDLASFPVYLRNYGGGQNALYAYLAAGFISLFGPSLFVLRLPAVLFSLITILCGTLIIKERFGKKTALMGAALLTIMPYFIMHARFGLESLLLLGGVTASLYLLLRALRTGKAAWFAAAGACFGLSLYAYALGYFILPLFFLLTLPYLLYIKRIRLRQILVMGAALLLVAWPLIVFVYINFAGLNTLQIGPFTICVLKTFAAAKST